MQEYGLKRGPLILILLICVAFVLGGISIIIRTASAPGPLLIGLLTIVFFGRAGFVMAYRLFTAGNVLSFSKDGLQSKLHFDGTLPWSEIATLEQMKIQRNDYLSFTVDPAFARSMNWRGPAVWFGMPKNQFSIALRQIDGPADVIAGNILAVFNADKGETQITDVNAAVMEKPARSYATYGLMALLLTVFFGELFYQYKTTSNFTISPETMIRFGGDLPYRITEDSEFWRIFTAPLLHASPFHISFNLLVLFWAGGVFERMAGWKYMLGLFAIGALAGEALSITFLDPEIVGVGASGGNAGLITGVLVMAARLPLQQSIRLRMGAVALLIPALLPAFASGGNVNVFAHGGGAVAGAAVSFALLSTWPLEKQKPPASNVMLAAAVIFFAVAVYAIYPITRLLAGA